MTIDTLSSHRETATADLGSKNISTAGNETATLLGSNRKGSALNAHPSQDRIEPGMPETPDLQESCPPSSNGSTVNCTASVVYNEADVKGNHGVTPGLGFPDIILLDVGGRYFSVARTTLLKEDSLLAQMFKGVVPVQRTPEGRYFIDRNPDTFSLVLDYLRDGFCMLPTTQDRIEMLVRECEHYQLDSLQLELMKVWWPKNLVSVKLKMRILARLGYSDSALGVIGVIITRLFGTPSMTQTFQDLSIAVSYTSQGVKNDGHQIVSFMETGTVDLSSFEIGARSKKQLREHFATRYETYGARSSNTVRKYDNKRYKREGFDDVPPKCIEEERALFNFHAKQEPLGESEDQTREFIDLIFKHHDAICHCLELLFGEANVHSDLEGLSKDTVKDSALQYPTAILWKATVEL